MSKRFALKAATDDFHRRLDERLSALNLGEADDYRRFLAFQARVVPPLENALADGGLGNLIAGWCQGRRAGAIQSDLAELGETMPDPADVPPIRSTAEMIGTAYVLEGSRLGGRYLQRQVGDGLPRSFLCETGEKDLWPEVVEAIDSHLYSDADIGEAKDAARRCFALYLNVAGEAGL